METWQWHLAIAASIGVVVGLVVAAARSIRRDLGRSVLQSAIVGSVGALIAFYAGHAVDLYRFGDLKGWFAAVIGAVVAILVFQFIADDAG